jgi:hypothetical protein
MTARLTFRTVLQLLLVAIALGACSGSQPSSETTAQQTAAGAPAQPGQAGPAPTEALGTGDAVALAADYEKQCASEAKPSEDCEILRSLLVVEVAEALKEIERSRDKRGTEDALAALDLVDEPEILVAACRILGQFPDTPGVAAKVLPLMLRSRYADVQRMAAQLLNRISGSELSQVGNMWVQNHDGLSIESPYTEYPAFPTHYANLGFPKYPKAEWFSPADSDRSVGWSTKESVANVSRWFSDTLKSPAVTAAQWMAERQALAAPMFDQSKMARMQQLMERVVKGDQAAVAEVQKLSEELDSQNKVRERAFENSVDKVVMNTGYAAPDAQFIVAQKKDGRVSRLVLVYPLPALQQTVIQLVWDLTDYPNAWGQAETNQ